MASSVRCCSRQINNWLEGHLWIKEKFGSAARPRVGWSLDPFGLSTSQAVMQSMMGFDAWFFTRVSAFVVDQRKQDKSLDFIWRASSSLPDKSTEIFTHIYESYYCMPLPTYAFEWGAAKGAKVPDASNVQQLASGLADIAKQRAAWYRSPHVLIPWGCDYQFQNADLVYTSTDWVIDTINAHPEWGVHVQYTTATEYLKAIQKADVPLPVKERGVVEGPSDGNEGDTFFPFNTWSGYFTSRPKLKAISQRAHGPLHAAEGLFALRTPKSAETQQQLWDLLETARRNAGVVQHHDAITGTPCSSQEGCAGVDQVMGAHNVLGVYEDMVSTTAANAKLVIAEILGEQTGLELTPSIEDFGNTLMDQKPITIVVYNSLASARTDIVSMQVPICNVGVANAAGAAVPSQVTAQFSMNDGIAPFYDFDLHFEVKLAPLSYATFTIAPLDGTQHCGGGDMVKTGATASFSQHVPTWPPSAKDAPSALDGLVDSLIADQQAMYGDSAAAAGGFTAAGAAAGAAEDMAARSGGQPKANKEEVVVMENKFLKVYVDTSTGIKAVFDKGAGKNYSFTHQLMEYQSNVNDAYDFKPKGPATPVGAAPPASPDLVQGCIMGCAMGQSKSTDACEEMCQASSGLTANDTPKVLMSSVSLGPVMQEVRLQISLEHKTRIRLWVSDDPAVGGRLELGHRIGVLEKMTEVASRFTVDELQGADFYSEDNGYEVIKHSSGSNHTNIPLNHFPSQMSTFISDGKSQLSVALEHGHGVASLYGGTLDVMQHRRGGPFGGSGSTVVLDDTDRLFTETWVSIGNVSRSNELRHSNKLRLNHPLEVMFGDAKTNGNAKHTVDPLAGKVESIEDSVHLQTVRATTSTADELLVNLLHIFGKEEMPAQSAQPKNVDLNALIAPFRPDLTSFNETTLNGMVGKEQAAAERMVWTTTPPTPSSPKTTTAATDGGEKADDGSTLMINPFEFRTFLATEFAAAGDL